MTRFAIRGLLSRKLRTGLTALAIVLGVAMISGTFVLTDSIDNAFDKIFTDIRQGSNAIISGKSAFDLTDDSGVEAPSFDESLLDRIRSLPDVAEAEGSVDSTSTQLIDENGKVIQFGLGGAPHLGFSIANPSSRFNPLTLVSGSWPKEGEVVIDKETASKKHLDAGDAVAVQVEGPVEKFRISGIMQFGSGLSIGGATLAGFDLPTAQRLFEKPGKLDEIAVAAKANVSDAALAREIREVLPPGTQVRTAAQQIEEDSADTNEFITFMRIFLLAFGFIALFVGSFVIANSLSITIAQRTRELATLRMIGASRRQLLRSIILEALVVGVLGSLVGLFVGFLLAKGLFGVFDLIGFDLPSTGLAFLTWTGVSFALVAGIVVTLLASLRPAIRATRVPPIAAVREGATLPRGRFARFKGIGAALVAALGFAALAYGVFADGLGTGQVLAWMGVGIVLVFLGVALFSSRFVKPLASLLGWPATRIGGAAGYLARDNARRNPQRTASTAAALMIGLTLVTLVATLAAGILASFRGAVNDLFVADYAITAQNNFSPIPVDAANAAAKVSAVTAVGNVRTGQIRVFDTTEFATAVDAGAAEVIDLTWKEGSQAVFSTLGEDGAFVDDAYADDHSLRLGSSIAITFPNGKTRQFLVEGIFDPPSGGSPFGAVTISAQAWDAEVPTPKNLFSFLKTTGGATDANEAALQRALDTFPNAKLATRQKFIDNQIAPFNRILIILYVLLALSVIVSLVGIVNTLVLTIFERTREIGMLRAIGMTRRQVRRMILHESIITALIGAALGITLGLVLAGLLVSRVEEIVFSFPTKQVVLFVLAAIVVGILASIFPARRAAKLDPLRAIAYE
ncbi:MAG: ABC transporter permease [Gaiellaceae bacterium]